MPRYPDVGAADRALRAIREEAARSWIALERNAWGEAAPEPPEARYDD